MRRTGRVILVFILIIGSMMGMWIFQSWREAKQKQQESTLHNAYVTDVSGASLQVLHEGSEKSLQMASAVTEQSITGVADLLQQMPSAGLSHYPHAGLEGMLH